MIIIIAAVSKDGFIGKNMAIPWRLKSDMAHFKEATDGHVVIMGRKTWESLPEKFRPLPNRRNIVITRKPEFKTEGAEVASSLEDALKFAEKDEFEKDKNVYIIGGGEIYKAALPYAEKIALTRVKTEIGEGDARFPELDNQKWNLISKKNGKKTEEDDYDFDFETYSLSLRYIEFAAVRSGNQLKTMRTIRQKGHCPFCPENLATYHKEPITYEGDYWLVTDNQWPYSGKNVHKLIISKKHAEDIKDLEPGAGEELLEIVKRIEEETGITGGGIGFRFGNPLLSGASVKHLHFQIISPQPGTQSKFYIGGNDSI